MKISCQSCGAKYNIADEKVRGKIVKIACKKCGARIEIDGREPSEQTTDHDETRVYEAGQLPTGTTVVADSWTVSVDDNDQREINTQQLIELYGQGVVTGETFVWREGMADWQPLRDVDALRDALAGAGGGGAAAPSYQSEPAAPAYGNGYGAHEEPVAAAPAASPLFGGGGGMEPSAARLGEARRGGAVDLFASPGAAHEDEDVATSAPQGGGMGFAAAGGGLAPATADGRPIGARNENSVLFSLSALTSSGPSTSAASAALDDEKSGLIDIQKLASAARPNGGDNRAQLDDIMNLGGGGAFGAALGAPILAPPPETALTAPAEPEKKKGNGALLAIVALFGVAIIALLVVLILKKPDDTGKAKDSKTDDEKGLKTEPTTEKTTKTKPAATAADTSDVVATPQPTASATASASVAAKPTTTIKAPTGPIPPTGPKPPTTTAPANTGATPPPPPPTSTKPKCKTLDECMGNH